MTLVEMNQKVLVELASIETELLGKERGVIYSAIGRPRNPVLYLKRPMHESIYTASKKARRTLRICCFKGVLASQSRMLSNCIKNG